MIYPLPSDMRERDKLLMRVAGYDPLTGAFSQRRLHPIFVDDEAGAY